uniref:Uncharacterized protein n=1 Tax=Stomoxys calcitrans TaxID=35570 RepID=A0A1I8NRD2_STOCA
MVTPALQPWEIVGWSPEQEQIIYRDWGRFFTHRQQLDTAVHYYNKSLELKSKDPKTLYFRSRCKRNIAQTKGALDDGKTAAGNISPITGKLSKYVEEVMGDYVVLKSLRVMPWKVEFINEVYNTLALAHVDSYTLLEDVLQTHGKERLLRLLRMPTDKLKDIVEFVFGDKSTYREADAPNYDQMAYQKFLARLQKRLIFTKYPVEKCYLLHEIARVHLKQSSFEQCCSWARKAIEASEHSNNLLWQLLSIMLIVKAHAALHKLESGKEALKEAMPIVKRLAIPKLCSFIDFCHDLNEQEIALKKSSQSMDSMRKRRSRASISSRNSSQSKNGSENGDSAKATISTARASDGAGDGV